MLTCLLRSVGLPSVPYSSNERQKEVFTLELFKAPEISVINSIYSNCTVTRYHGNGFSTTITSVASHEDGGYTVELRSINR